MNHHWFPTTPSLHFLKKAIFPTSIILILFHLTTSVVQAAGADPSAHSVDAIVLLYLALLLVAAKVSGIIEKIGQPGVLGELGAGIMLSGLAFFGFSIFNDIRQNQIMGFIAELGAIILLFQIGLESNLRQMTKVGSNALAIAIIGVVAPFGLGYAASTFLFPTAASITHLFVGASLVATSVGITAYVFQQFHASKSRACQTVLGAAVIDDVLGLIILALVSSLAAGNTIDVTFVSTLLFKAFSFLFLAVFLGSIAAKPLSKAFSKISTGTGMKFTIALSFALMYSYLATLVGLAPIVGAFAAGLILDAVHFNSFDLPPIAQDLEKLKLASKSDQKQISRLIHKHQHAHVEALMHNLGLMLIPVFFVYTGLQIEFESLLNPTVYLYAAVISVLAIIGKVIAGIAAKGNLTEKLLVGVSMVPRGEVGLIFAATGKSLGVIPDTVFSAIIIVIIVTTFIAPPLIQHILRRLNANQKTSVPITLTT